MRTSRWQIVLAVVFVAAGLAVLGSWARRGRGVGCALDGVRIDPPFRVRVVDEQGGSEEFCCIRCAERWLGSRRGPPQAVYVTDEAEGQEVDARDAWYVRSAVVTTPTSGNRTHAFRDRADAERHAASARGTLLTGPDRPFSGR
jgi:NosL